MKTIISISLSLMIAFSLTGCSGLSENNDTSTTSPTAENAVSETQVPEEFSSEETNVFADDDIVNQFITDYNAISQSGFTDIEKGNIRTKVFAFSYGYYCELLNANDTNNICVTINETDDNAEIGVSGMRDVFHDVAITIDPSLSDEDVYTHFDKLVASEYMKEGDTLGTMTILYVPDKELSSGYSRGHIEIKAQ